MKQKNNDIILDENALIPAAWWVAGCFVSVIACAVVVVLSPVGMLWLK